jgi:hypothetical protein
MSISSFKCLKYLQPVSSYLSRAIWWAKNDITIQKPEIIPQKELHSFSAFDSCSFAVDEYLPSAASRGYCWRKMTLIIKA